MFAASRTISASVLALRPRVIVAVHGYPETFAVLQGADCRVERFAARNLCVAAEGGPTCLTRPIARASLERDASDRSGASVL